MVQPIENAINGFLLVFNSIPSPIRAFIYLVAGFTVIYLLFDLLWNSR